MAAPVPVWSGVVTPEGVVRLDARELFHAYVRGLKNTAITLVVKKASRPKSQNQLGYLFGVLYPVIAEELGYRSYEVEEVHDAFMRRLRGLKPEPNPLQLRESLRDHDHQYTSDYIGDLRHFVLTEYGIVTPDAEKAERAA
jgi:hypothetical protein